jgi:hypothetical protein
VLDFSATLISSIYAKISMKFKKAINGSPTTTKNARVCSLIDGKG